MIHLDRAGECAFETIVLDLREILLQDGIGSFVLPQDGRAQIGAGLAEETDARSRRPRSISLAIAITFIRSA